MQKPIYLDPALVPSALRGAYAGKQFKAVVCETMTIPSDAGLWSGGSRNVYSVIDIATGKQASVPGQDTSPWNGGRRDGLVRLKPGLAVVEHTIFSGKDLGLTFYVHPDNAAKLLPAPVELTENEAIVLGATANLKSSYNGKDRYEMRRDDTPLGKPFMTRDEWNAAKQSLIARGLLNKAGAITTAGKNARR